MEKLEDYLGECTRPFKGVTIEGHLQKIEDFYSSLYGSLGTDIAFRNPVIRGEQGKPLGRLSFLVTKPSVSAIRLVSHKEYEKHPADFIIPTLSVCRFIADRFGIKMNTSLTTYKLIDEGYRLSERNWFVSPNNEPEEVSLRTYGQTYLKWENGRLVYLRGLKKFRANGTFSKRE